MPAPQLAKTPADKLLGSFESTITLDYGNFSATGYISRQPPAYFLLELSSPQELAGLRAELDGDVVNFTYKGVSIGLDPKTVPGSAALNMLAAAVDSAARQQGVRVAYNEGVVDISGEVAGGSFVLSLDKENGNLLKLTSPENKLDMRFSGFRFLE